MRVTNSVQHRGGIYVRGSGGNQGTLSCRTLTAQAVAALAMCFYLVAGSSMSCCGVL